MTGSFSIVWAEKLKMESPPLKFKSVKKEPGISKVEPVPS